MDMIRAVDKEVKLQTMIINSYIPQEYQEQLEEVVQWQEKTGEWYMPGVAYAGNHMRKHSPEPGLTKNMVQLVSFGHWSLGTFMKLCVTSLGVSMYTF